MYRSEAVAILRAIQERWWRMGQVNDTGTMLSAINEIKNILSIQPRLLAEVADDASFLGHIANALRRAENKSAEEGDETAGVSAESSNLTDALAAITRLRHTARADGTDESRVAAQGPIEPITVDDDVNRNVHNYSRYLQEVATLIAHATAFYEAVEEVFREVSAGAPRWPTYVPYVLDRAYLIDQSRAISTALLEDYTHVAETAAKLAEIVDIDTRVSRRGTNSWQFKRRAGVLYLRPLRAEEILFSGLDGPTLESARALYGEFKSDLAAARRNIQIAEDIAKAVAWVHQLVGRNEVFSWLAEPAASIADLADMGGDIAGPRGDSGFAVDILLSLSSHETLSTLLSQLILIANRADRLAHIVELDRPERPNPITLAAGLLEALLEASMALEAADPDELERLITEASRKQDAHINLRNQAGEDESRISGLGQLQLQISAAAADKSLQEIRSKLDAALTVRVAMLGALLENARLLLSAAEDVEKGLLIADKWERQNRAAAEAFAEQLAIDALDETHASSGSVVVIYVSDDRDASKVEQSVERVVGAFGGYITQRGTPLLGSWLRILKTKAKDAASTEKGQDIALKLQRAIELKNLHETQARVDELQAGAAAKLIESVQDTPRAFIQIGSIVLIKDDGVLAVITLSQRQLVFLERNPHLIRNPLELLAALRSCDSDPSLQLVKGDGVADEQ
ncbi:hypothetical protein FH608_035075 [Nonomuraea phyllanthi]|uniref:Uncharacterized protein n=1 Tax=Nonomuraea phyllanthi TaxID=2219224 RepID=A0A5C4VVG8_9ACTN|nr:hypothetical protein [Nonomuraea phyllanthi]KAB8190212.1 hypothetical protein FH608_035075 [Nonomuraea phyllanthi]